MEILKILLGNPGAYDKAVHCGVADGGDLTIITKDHAMKSGAAAAVLTFTCEIDGKVHQVQTTVTVVNLKGLCGALAGRYDDAGRLLPHHVSDGSEKERNLH